MRKVIAGILIALALLVATSGPIGSAVLGTTTPVHADGDSGDI